MHTPGRRATRRSRCTNVDIRTPTHAERARTLVAQISTGTLCTLAHEPEGYPYGSFVTVAFDSGNPIFLISGLAEHTKNLERDARASLLVAEGGSADPLANGRVTVLGPCTRVGDGGASARTAFFAAHPNSTYYADFRDFAFWKLRVDSVRYIGGYGRMSSDQQGRVVRRRTRSARSLGPRRDRSHRTPTTPTPWCSTARPSREPLRSPPRA